MTSIGELFPKCRKLAYDARQQVAQVQQGVVSATDLYVLLEELSRQLNAMEELVYRETPVQRDVWNRKIAELRHECTLLHQQGTQAAHSASRYRNPYGQERDELLRRRRRRGNESDVQDLSQESSSLEQSQNMVFGLIDQGQASLNGLIEQRQRLRGVTRMVFDIGNRLGLSQSTMKIIERRDITDAYLVAGGMIVTILVIYFVWF
jgi:Golgi SNAP receptor complex protein 2